MDEHLERQFGVYGVRLLDDAQQPAERFLDWLILYHGIVTLDIVRVASKHGHVVKNKIHSCDTRHGASSSSYK